MYFDAVLTKDMQPIFNGTPEETKKFLREQRNIDKLVVCNGRTLKVVPAAEYGQK